jgi:Patatin-like phospholipase
MNDSRPLSLFDVLVEEYERQVKTHGLKRLYLDDTEKSRSITRRLKLTKELRELAEVLPTSDKRRESLLQSAEKLCIKAEKLRIKEKRKQVKTDFKHLVDEKERDKRIDEELVKDFFQRLHRSDVKRAALCFSGGGIRSATFALGLLQGLAQNGLELSRFHYVSTVSGGGYIGSWLSAWIHRQGMERVQADLSRSTIDSQSKQDERKKKAGAKSTAPISPLDPEPEPIQHLRRYSNYLSPKLGLFSADTWTLVGTFLRNLSLHWLVLIPLMIAALAIPRLAVSIASWNYPRAWAENLMILIGFITGIFSVTYLIVNLPSLRSKNGLSEKWRSEPKFLWLGWLPLIVAAFFSSVFWSWIHIPYGSDFKFFGLKHDHPLPFVAFGFLIHIVAYLVALKYLQKTNWVELFIRGLTGILGGVCLWAMALAFSVPVRITQKENQPAPQAAQAQATSTQQPISASSATIASPSLPVKIEIAVTQQPVRQEPQKGADEIKAISFQAGLYTCLAPSLFLLAFLIAATVFTGFASGHNNDADREWMARAGGWMLIAIFGWTVTSGLVIFGPVGLLWLWREFQVSLISVGAGSGLLTLLGGFSAKTSANKKDEATKSKVGMTAGLLSRSLPLAATVFTVIILAALSLMTSGLIAVAYASAKYSGGLLYKMADWTVTKLPWVNAHLFFKPFPKSVNDWSPLPKFSTANEWWHLEVLYQSPTVLVFSVVGIILAIGLLMGWFININKFSFHSAYRDRLIRAYLGASHSATRQPNPFTGFDDKDNIQMHDLLTDLFYAEDFERDKLTRLINNLRDETIRSSNPISDYIWGKLSESAQNLLKSYEPIGGDPEPAERQKDEAVRRALAEGLNQIIQRNRLYEEPGFAETKFTEERRRLWDTMVAPVRERQVNLYRFNVKPVNWLRRRSTMLENILLDKAVVERLRINRLLLEMVYPELPKLEESEKRPRPMHVVNTALNLVGGKELAWQERKAQSFTVSPLHAGSNGLGYRDVKKYAVSLQSQGALSLGTSMAISGAAVSPNMGYHSSPAVTFLLTLFNVRLGWWLGNPGVAGERTYKKPSPVFAPKPLIAETLGMTDGEHSYVYLSDGAHFENLGLYEMALRRCRYIVVSDAGADPDFSFEDLGNAIRKIRTDLGIPIVFEEITIRAREKAETLFSPNGAGAENVRKYCAIAKICYSAVDGGVPKEVDGTLIYIKPTVYGLEPADVLNYAKANEQFPHETTGDQMYSESQFESYRALGAHVIQAIAISKKDYADKIVFEDRKGLYKPDDVGPFKTPEEFVNRVRQYFDKE